MFLEISELGVGGCVVGF